MSRHSGDFSIYSPETVTSSVVRPDSEHFGPSDLSFLQLPQGSVGFRQRKFLNGWLQGNFRGQVEKLSNVLTTDVGHALNGFFKPKITRIIDPGKLVTVAVFFADGIDHQPSAGLKAPQ